MFLAAQLMVHFLDGCVELCTRSYQLGLVDLRSEPLLHFELFADFFQFLLLLELVLAILSVFSKSVKTQSMLRRAHFLLVDGDLVEFLLLYLLPVLLICLYRSFFTILISY